jgi:hypothetical protein
MFRSGDKVAVTSNREGSTEIYGPRIVSYCEPRYVGGKDLVKIFCNGKDESGGWIEYDAETGRDGGYPGYTLLAWTPEVEARVRLYEKQSKIASLAGRMRETQWHRRLTDEQADAIIAVLEPIRDDDSGERNS